LFGYWSLRVVLTAALAGYVSLSPLSSAGADAVVTSRPAAVGPSGLPLPRFVSLKAGRVNLRVGPGRNYAVDWLYLKPGLPMEIIQEYDNWRRVRDSEGAEGWINQSLLSGRRTAIAAPWNRGKDATVSLFAQPDETARVVALVEPGAMGQVRQCNGTWCEMTFDAYSGWVRQAQVWGAYPGESINDR
jgi:SH3-like domain-containing protein